MNRGWATFKPFCPFVCRTGKFMNAMIACEIMNACELKHTVRSTERCCAFEQMSCFYNKTVTSTIFTIFMDQVYLYRNIPKKC